MVIGSAEATVYNAGMLLYNGSIGDIIANEIQVITGGYKEGIYGNGGLVKNTSNLNTWAQGSGTSQNTGFAFSNNIINLQGYNSLDFVIRISGSAVACSITIGLSSSNTAFLGSSSYVLREEIVNTNIGVSETKRLNIGAVNNAYICLNAFAGNGSGSARPNLFVEKIRALR